jgi:predicted AlkP superfamily pyrophosphatase or phosphodiesterase
MVLNYKKSVYFLVILSFIVITFSCKGTEKTAEKNYVVVLSMDGFRWDYTDMTDTPVLDSIAKIGVKATSFKPAFPSKTFPNHYSLATGLYPDNHGIVQNNFYDEEFEAIYRIGDRNAVEDGKFYGGEPIWVTAEKQGVTSASYFWVGSEAPIQGIQPTYWKRYDNNFPNEARVDSVINWLQLPVEKRPRLIMWYFSEPDGYGHRYGPGSDEVNKKVTQLDSLLGVFIQKLNQLPHKNQVDFIILSDHGMSSISVDRYIDLQKHIKQDWVSRAHGGNPAIMINAAEGYADSIVSALSQVPNLKAWKNEDVPERLHYGKNPRSMDILVLADNTWSIGWGEIRGSYSKGTHGYDNDEMDMHAIFYAFGPSFKKGYTHETIEVVDLYPLIAHLLKLQPAEVDGNLSNTKDMLK